MKLFFYVLIVVGISISCTKTKNHDASVQSESSIDYPGIIEKVRNKSITTTYTTGMILDSLARDGIVSWQVFQPEEYKNDSDIVGVEGTSKSKFVTTTLSYKMVYLYQISTQKVIFYTGSMNESPMSEYEFIVNWEQMKQMRQLF
ncbi:MAG: hypothetical protein ACERKD_22305 [Prolixibacteraceae bacterium]